MQGYRFFTPSAELAEAVMAQNQQLVSEYVQRNFPTGYETGVEFEPEDDLLPGTPELERLRPRGAVDRQGQIVMGQRLIAERLYHYLSSLSESPWAMKGLDFPIKEYVPDGMASMLGLSAYRDLSPDSPRAIEISKVLERIAAEFRDWLLEEHGSFVTPWIEMHLSAHDSLRLTAVGEIRDFAAEVEVGQSYLGIVTRIVDFGAFVKIFPQTEGLLHISDIADRRVRDVREELEDGQHIWVKVIRKDGNKIRLSMKDSEVSRSSDDSHSNALMEFLASAAVGEDTGDSMASNPGAEANSSAAAGPARSEAKTNTE